jgi:small subunit ribosomal protein S17
MSDKKTSKKPAAAKTKSVPPPPSQPARASVRPASTEAAPPTEVRKGHSFRRKLTGTVTSDKMDKTVVVEVIRKAMHPVYKKYIRVRNKYKAHDELNVYKIGDQVEITENRPISREKRWLVTRLVSRPVEA